MSSNIEKYTCWCEDHPEQGETEIEALRGASAAKKWLDDRWFDLDQPSEARVFVRAQSGKVSVYDVHVDGIMLELCAVAVPTDENGRPLTYEQLVQRAQAAGSLPSGT